MKKLADDVAAFLNSAKEAGAKPLCELGVETARTTLLDMTLDVCLAHEEVAQVREQSIPVEEGEISVRLYWPDVPKGEKTPLLVHYHGGGWALGDLDTHDTICRYYCNQISAVVMSVHYRLAPEWKFPTGLEDCYSALCWAVENAEALAIDPNRVAVTGDSAGGNLSAVVCIMSKKRNGPGIKYQALVYPGVDITPESAERYPSIKQFGTDYFLTAADIEWLRELYFDDPEDAYNILASPILYDDLQGLPSALVITAGFDPLVDQGKAYADKMTAAGIDVEYYCIEDSIHGFINFAGLLDSGKQGLQIIADRIKQHL